MTRPLRIGTRGSALALVQARWAAARLAELDVPTELVIIRTEGDDRPVDTPWGEGAFVARIMAALLDGSVDVAVHSAKDVPTDEPLDLAIAAYPPRQDPRDALVCRVRGSTLATLPEGSRVGTDSPRRTAFLRALRPDLRMHPLHGNVDTRLAKLDQGDSDALVLAMAGLIRLGRSDRVDDVLPSDTVPSAPGQGALAIQVRASDAEAFDAVARLDDPATRIAVISERLLLNATGGGCRSPIGAIGVVVGDRFELRAGAERTWTSAPGAAVRVSPVVWIRGQSDREAHRLLAQRLAARIVAVRTRPRVLLTRSDSQAAALLAALDGAGVDAVNVPAIEISPLGPDGPLDAALATLAEGTWVVLTSANAARATLAALGRVAIDGTLFRWAAVGSATARVLRTSGIGDPFVPSAANGRVLADELPIGHHDNVLLPRSDAADGTLPDALRGRGAQVQEVLAYRTLEAPAGSRPRLSQALDEGPVDAVVLTSGSTARGLLALADDDARSRLLRAPVVAIGEPTAGTARGLGFQTVLVAPSPVKAGLAAFTAHALGIGPAPAISGGTP